MKFLIAIIIGLVFCSEGYSQYYGNYYNGYVPGYQINADRIRTRWQIQDEYKERNKTENYLDRKERMLDQAERAYEIKLREDDLRYRGILPPKDPNAGTFEYEGVKFHSFDEFKNSPEYQILLKRREEKEVQRLTEQYNKEYEKQRYYAFLKMWSNLGLSGKERFNSLSEYEKEKMIDKYDK